MLNCTVTNSYKIDMYDLTDKYEYHEVLFIEPNIKIGILGNVYKYK